MKRLLFFSLLLTIWRLEGAGQTGNTVTGARGIEQEVCADSFAVQKIRKALSIPDVVGMTAEEFAEYNPDSSLLGLQRVELDTGFNGHCLLGIIVTGEWSAAYVQGFTDFITFDQRTGNKLSIGDLLKEDSLASLNQQLLAQIKENAAAQRQDLLADKEYDGDISEYDAQVSYSLEEIRPGNVERFYLTAEGIVFQYEFHFGHAFWSIEPGPVELSLSINELQPYIKPGGPLSFWLRP